MSVNFESNVSMRAIENIENIENIYCHSLSVQYNTMLFVYRMYTKSIFIYF